MTIDRKFLPGTGRGTMPFDAASGGAQDKLRLRRSMVEGARLSAATAVGPLHHALRARSPSPFRGGAR